MEIYNPNIANISYRMNLKWMKRKMLATIIGRNRYDEMYNNTWYDVLSNYDMNLIIRPRVITKRPSLNILYVIPAKTLYKLIPNIRIEKCEYLAIFSNRNGDIYRYHNSFFTKLNKYSYHKVLKVKLGMRDVVTINRK